MPSLVVTSTCPLADTSHHLGRRRTSMGGEMGHADHHVLQAGCGEHDAECSRRCTALNLAWGSCAGTRARTRRACSSDPLRSRSRPPVLRWMAPVTRTKPPLIRSALLGRARRQSDDRCSAIGSFSRSDEHVASRESHRVVLDENHLYERPITTSTSDGERDPVPTMCIGV